MLVRLLGSFDATFYVCRLLPGDRILDILV